MSAQKNRITVTTGNNSGQKDVAQVAQSPQDRIRETVQLILRVYGKPSAQKSKRIYIDQA